MKNLRLLILLSLLFTTIVFAQEHSKHKKEEAKKVNLIDFQSLVIYPKKSSAILDKIGKNWDKSYIPILIESITLSRSGAIDQKILSLLKSKTKQDFKLDLDKWYQWSWSQDIKNPDFYADYKGWAYSWVDKRFIKYFENNPNKKIRLDEIRWGGVKQDGIPPLRGPKMLEAKKADYLDDSNVVFGVSINGDSRAYPKRILAWHEMFVDKIGGVDVTGAYCTLCGSMIAYDSKSKKGKHNLGTSGFLYRSNKLMYDKETNSLWNTIIGEPVLGSLVDKGIKLELLSVVTTTWGEWKKRHPKTTVLSLDTGHKRDYSEGRAYRDYFATDELMFTVPKIDKRLKNKDEILAIRFDDNAFVKSGIKSKGSIAISKKFLDKTPLYHDKGFVVLTDVSGANRVYELKKDIKFSDWDKKKSLVDSSKIKWTASEDELKSSKGTVLKRLPAHRAFWFGWNASNPDTKLIK